MWPLGLNQGAVLLSGKPVIVCRRVDREPIQRCYAVSVHVHAIQPQLLLSGHIPSPPHDKRESAEGAKGESKSNGRDP